MNNNSLDKLEKHYNNSFSDHIKSDAIIISLGGLILFYYIAIISHNPLDPSYYTATFPLADKVYNYAGVLGAEISAFFITWLGLVSYVFPLLFLLVTKLSKNKSINAIKPNDQFQLIKLKNYSTRFFNFLFKTVFLVSIACLCLALVNETKHYGGWLGYYIKSNFFINFGQIGTWIIAITCLFLYISNNLKKSYIKEAISLIYKNLFNSINIKNIFKSDSLFTNTKANKDYKFSLNNNIEQFNYKISNNYNDITNDSSTNKNNIFTKTKIFITKYLLVLRSKLPNIDLFSFNNNKNKKHHKNIINNHDHSKNNITNNSIEIKKNNLDNLENIDINIKEIDNLIDNFNQDDNNININHHNYPIGSDKELILEPNSKTNYEKMDELPKIHPFKEYLGFFKKRVNYLENNKNQELNAQITSELLQKTLNDFAIKGKMLGWFTGPRVRTFEFLPDSGVKQTKLIGLIDDISRSLKVDSVLIQPLQGKSALGIQVPRKNPITIYLADILSNQKAPINNLILPISLGMCPRGTPVTVDLASMPHLLIAGATGSGKSVGIHSLINSILCAKSCEEVRMILVDPKMLELSAYQKMPHLAAPVITDPKQACLALQWALTEMDNRYKIMQDLQVRNIASLNKKIKSMNNSQKQEWQDLYPDLAVMPYLVIIIDELADLMLTASKEVESAIQRLSQKARACGMHLILATQRPSVDVITGVIKANFPARIAFQVVSKHDSRTILDQIGAERLLGRGDMLFQNPGTIRPQRLQGAFVSEQEIDSLLARLKLDYNLSYNSSLLDKMMENKNESSSDNQALNDPMWQQAIELAEEKGSISASYLQRRLMIGYNRAARIVEKMESQNLVAPANGPKPRKWLYKKDDY